MMKMDLQVKEKLLMLTDLYMMENSFLAKDRARALTLGIVVLSIVEVGEMI